MDEIGNAGLKGYLNHLARVGDMAGFLKESNGSVHLYLYTHGDGDATHEFKVGDEIKIWTYVNKSAPTPETFRYVE